MNKFQYYTLLFVVSPITVFAGDASLFDLTLEELMHLRVVTAASGFEQNINKTPASVTIIKAEEWQARGAKSLTQALLGAPNIEVNSFTTGYSRPKYSIRGLSGVFGQQVVILIDGLPINRLLTGSSPPLTDLPLQGYKRIEIIRSPGSVVYGADAFGGIINLVSYGIDEQPDEVNLTIGEFNTFSLGGNVSFSVDEVKVQLSANYQTFDDDPDRIISSDLQSTLDNVLNTSASKAPGNLDNSYESLALKGKIEWQSWSLFYNGIDGNIGLGGGVAQALDPNSRGSYQHHLTGINYDLSSIINDTPVDGELAISAWYNYQKSSFKYFVLPPGTVLPIGSDGNLNFTSPTTLTTFTDGYIGEPGNRNERYHLSLKHLFFLADDHQIRWEVGYEKQDLKAFEKKNFGPTVLNGTETVVNGTLTDVSNTPYVYMPNKKRNFIFASLQDQWQLTESLLFNIGARFDDYSDVGSTFNPRLGLNWSATEKFSIRLFGGSAFRAPTFADLYAQNNPASAGNINIKPEEIWTYELGANYQFTDTLRTAVTLFSYSADSLIDYVLDESTGGQKAKNVGKQHANGFEWELHWRPMESVDISSNYSYTHSDDANGNETANIAKQLATTVINWQITEQIYMNIASHWVMGRRRPKGDMRDPLKDYAMISAKVSHGSLDSGLEFSLSVNNLLADDIRHPSNGTIADDFPQASRQWLAEVVYHF
jgi:iron complex outermembrane receptor protein